MNLGESTFEVKGIRIGFSMYAPTWNYYYKGWRKFASKIKIIYPRVSIDFGSWYLFRKYLKQEKQRQIFMTGGMVICSPENYAWIQKNGLPDWIKK